MKSIKTVGLVVITFLLVFGSFFVWQVWAQDDNTSGGGLTLYLPWIAAQRTQTETVDVSTDASAEVSEVVSDTVWLFKPGEDENFRPTPVPDIPFPDHIQPLMPGQPPVIDTRPPQEELEALAENYIPPDAPYQVGTVMDHFTDSKVAAQISSAVVIAKVSKIYPSLWNTPDGKRPANPFDWDHPSYIYTLIDIQVQEVIKGTVKPGNALTIFKNGGQVGEDMLVVETYFFEFVEGDTLFLYTDPITVDFPGDYWRINERYTIDPSTNTAANSVETRLLDDLRVEVATAAK